MCGKLSGLTWFLIETLINVHAYFYNVTEFSFIENISHEKMDICPHNGKILAYTFFVIPIHLVVKLDDLVHLPRWVTMHVLRAPTWAPWLRIKMLMLNILGTTVYFGWFSRWPPRQKTKCLHGVISDSHHLLCLLLWADHLYLKILNSFSGIKS